MNLSLIVGIGGHWEQKANAKRQICFNAAGWVVCFQASVGGLQDELITQAGLFFIVLFIALMSSNTFFI